MGEAMTAATSQAAWDALRRERDDLLLAIDRCEETKTALHMNLRAMRDERDELAALVEVLRYALEYYAHGGSVFRQVAATALDSTKTAAADILRQRYARTLRDAAHIFDNEAGLAG